MELLSKKESIQYLQEVLHISISDTPDITDTSVTAATKLSFLETIIRAFLEHEPFQSIYLMSHDVTCRRRPTWEEIKRDLLLGRGGLCYWLNTFMYALLASLGFDVSMTYSTYNVGIYSPNNHVIVFVHDLLAPGSLHLVDVGLGYSIPRAISLDFKHESPEYTDSFMTYKFQRESDSMMYLVKKVTHSMPAASAGHTQQELHQNHASSSNKDHDESEEKPEKNSTGEQSGDHKVNTESKVNEKETRVSNGPQNIETIQQISWQQLYFFNPLIALKELEPFYDCFDICFTDITKLSTHSSPRAMCWPGGRFVALVNSKLIQENNQGQLKKTSVIELGTKPTVGNENDGHRKDNIKLNSLTRFADSSEHPISKSVSDTVNSKSEDVNNHVKNSIEVKDQDELAEFEPLIQAYKEYFPQFPPQMVKAALKNWKATGTIFPIPTHLA